MIAIVDYGTSNLGSMQNMLKKIGAASRIAASPNDLDGATKIIVPGVGSFDAGMGKLRDLETGVSILIEPDGFCLDPAETG